MLHFYGCVAVTAMGPEVANFLFSLTVPSCPAEHLEQRVKRHQQLGPHLHTRPMLLVTLARLLLLEN